MANKRKEEGKMAMNTRSVKTLKGLLSLRALALSLALILVSVVFLVSVIIIRITA